MKWLLLVAGCLAVTGLAYWKNLPEATSPAPAVVAESKAPATANNEAAPALPSRDVAAVAPLKESATATATSTAPATNKTTPARVTRRDQPSTVATAERRENVVPPSAPAAGKAPARATTYEQRVANAAKADDSDRALTDLQRLAADEPNRPEAYEAMAGLNLKKKDYAQAREQIASALAHGGKATFSLIHDHNKGNFESKEPNATCVGELTILADEVKFEAPGDTGDRFAANWTDVRDAGSNKFFGSGIGGFHLTITAGGKYKNINLAPESKDKAEGKLILDLLNANTRRDRTK
jgi:tetratricopeptide (TPR) repeat protein